MTLHLPDVSEFQPNVDWAAVGQSVGAAIARVHNGRRMDYSWSGRQAAMRAHLTVRGFYGYVVADRDPGQQGREFAALVGRLQPGEFAACDLEEGGGDQSARAEAWCAAVDRACGGRTWVYSGASFFADHLSGVQHRPRWVASYGSGEPQLGHVLWQHTDREQHAGIGACDCSIFNGSLSELRQLTNQEDDVTPQDKKDIINGVLAGMAPLIDDRVRLLLFGDGRKRGSDPGNHPETISAIYADTTAIRTKLGA